MATSTSPLAVAAAAAATTAAMHFVLRRLNRSRGKQQQQRQQQLKPVKVLVFDIDDCLYPVTNGFTNHRNNGVAISYMCETYGFGSRDAAAAVRTPYFKKYHSTAKALAVACQEGAVPPKKAGGKAVFDPAHLSKYWATKCDFTKYIARDEPLIEVFRQLKASGLHIVAMTNAPRAYGAVVLETIGIREFFKDELLFGVDDFLPNCKPELEAFRKVLNNVKRATGDDTIELSDCVMFEDSMKNVRGAKKAGMGTVLVVAGVGLHDTNCMEDAGVVDDPAVDHVIRVAKDILPSLDCLRSKQFPFKVKQ
ncbi:hypothetical protein TrST_g12647 [Triparma strigata]|uniref:Uncharacterized protein n=1 Tax=Triparma strigata TaxID=1606541 RepID=A0A9W7BWA5_9STRA|nr:hypothetical protein TrST_g12647 [Triparma strigata]